MIHGSTHIIGSISGRYLHPMLLAESQDSRTTGYIAVAYETDPRRYDLLFLEGRSIIGCARMNQDLRFHIDQNLVISSFRENIARTSVHLFTCPPELLQRFITTIASEPCLKVHVDALSKRQIATLVRSTGCREGIIERNDFSGSLPVIELMGIHSSDTLPDFSLGIRKGRLLVYDLKKNNEIQSHTFTGNPSRTLQQKKRRKRKSQKPESGHVCEVADQPNGDSSSPAAAIESLVHEILGSTGNQPSTVNDEPKPLLGPPSAVDTQDSTVSSPLTLSSSSTSTSTPSSHDTSEPPPPEALLVAPVATQQSPSDEQPSPYLHAMERLLRTFRQQIIESCGERSRTIFAKAEKKTLMLNPEFNPAALTVQSASRVLSLIEEMVRLSPMLKRSKLRDTAAELVSDLYNKHYDLLATHNVIDAIEQSYFRLKGGKS